MYMMNKGKDVDVSASADGILKAAPKEFAYFISCDKCGNPAGEDIEVDTQKDNGLHGSWHIENVDSPDDLVKALGYAGWSLQNGKLVCFQCKESEEKDND